VNLEEMKMNLPISLITKSIYFHNSIFIFTSTILGFIDFSDHLKTREFITVRIPITNYVSIQPVILENYSSNFNKDNDIIQEHITQRKVKANKEKKDLFTEAFLDKSIHSYKTGISLEMIQQIKNNKNLYFLAISNNSIDVYSQTKMIKSFNYFLPKFKTTLQQGKKYKESDVEYSRMYSKKDKSRNNETYMNCIFKKNGIFSTYHESSPQYMFILIYNCDYLIQKNTPKKIEENTCQNESFLSRYIKNMSDNIQTYGNKIKILTFEIFSDQFLSVDLLTNIEDNIESYGKMRLFKNFREFLVIVYKVKMIKHIGRKKSHLKLVIKKFDKYNGFKSILDKNLDFDECENPFYDILYTYKKGSGKQKFERKRGKYSFNSSYSKGNGKRKKLGLICRSK
jgi:hypothetical protein